MAKDELKQEIEAFHGQSAGYLLWQLSRLFNATPAQRANWEPCGAGYGIHWPDIDEDLSTEGLLRGAPAPKAA